MTDRPGVAAPLPAGRRPADRLHLSPRHRTQLEALLREHLPDVEVWAYGSRITGESHDGSDLDLVLRAPDLQKIPVGRLSDLWEALRESTIPFLVEARDWARLPEGFHGEIERDYVVLVKETKQHDDNGWLTTTLGDVITLKRGYDLSRHERVNGPVPVVSSSGIIDYHSDSKVSGPGVVTGRYGTLGQVFFIPNDFWPLNTALYVQDFKGNDPRFIAYFLRTLDFSVYSDKAAVPGLNRNHLHQESVRIPTSISEQRAIAHVLGALDDKIELNRRMNETLEAMARALFKSWFVDFDPVRAKMEGRDTGLPKDIADLFPDRLVDSTIGLAPEGWAVTPLTVLMEVNPKRSLSRGRVAPYLDMANMPTRGHVPDTVVDRPVGSGTRFTNGDTLVARITPCLENGKTAYVDFLRDKEIGWGSTEYIVLKPRRPLPGEFAYCVARSAIFREFAIRNMSGTSGRQRVPAASLCGFWMSSPSAGVAAEFGRLSRSLFGRASQAAYESLRLACLRDSLLKKLLSGELRVGEMTNRSSRVNRNSQSVDVESHPEGSRHAQHALGRRDEHNEEGTDRR